VTEGLKYNKIRYNIEFQWIRHTCSIEEGQRLVGRVVEEMRVLLGSVEPLARKYDDSFPRHLQATILG
jgi:hypothetical protein